MSYSYSSWGLTSQLNIKKKYVSIENKETTKKKEYTSSKTKKVKQNFRIRHSTLF